MANRTRNAILDAAVQVLERPEGAGFTLEDVAAEAGVSRQTLYQYFRGRAELLVETAEYVKRRLDFDALAAPVLAAPNAEAALERFLDLHASLSPALLPAARAVEVEQLRRPEVRRAFDARSTGRRQLAHHVAIRLHAEGLLDEGWSAEAAADLIAAMTAPGITAELLERRGWGVEELQERILYTLRATLVASKRKEIS